MIHIEKGQKVPEHDDLRVLSVDGDYDDNDLIECAHTDNPDFALCAFSASFVRYGGVVHQFSDPEMLGKALLALDPKCTHNAATLYKEEEARRLKRLGGDFTPENPVPVDENVSLVAQEEAKEAEKEKEEEKEEDEPARQPTPESEEPALDIPPPASDVSSTTPAVLEPGPEASTTPVIPVTPIDDAATTTEEIVSLIKRKVAKKILS